MSETTFTFSKNPYIWKFINRQFRLGDTDETNDIYNQSAGEGDYTFVLAESVPSNVLDCISEDTGCLIEDIDGLSLIELTDIYSEIGVEMPYFNMKTTFLDNGNGFTFELDSGDDSSVQIQLGDAQDIYLQGIFLCKRLASETNTPNFVLAYSSIHDPINVRTFFNVPYNGLVFGVGVCGRNLSNRNIDDIYYTI